MKKISLMKQPYDLERYETWRSQWEDPVSVGLNDYISECCHPEDILISMRLFIPEFIAIDDCILLYDRYEESNFLQWMDKLSGEKISGKSFESYTYL
ncbi:hypothetical protein [Kluyvera genomosp. 2]|uniref:hypothetical protein n=1 Tax=Kluyvera genomosp. 2 TaxID=2774054 RepID=UPI002FD80637